MPGSGLPSQLKRLVHDTEALLGGVVAQAEGRTLLDKVERIRRLMVALRNAPKNRKRGFLSRAFREVSALSPKRRAAFARA